MKLRVYYDNSEIQAEILDTSSVEILEPLSLDSEKSESEIIMESLNNPVSSPNFERFIQDYESILIIVNDHARSTPTPKILKHILPVLAEKKIGIIVASGTHPLPSEDDLKELILGEFYSELRDILVFHNSKAESNFITLGVTSRETKVRINKIINDYDAIITINSIEPHYFAGFTGGRKSFLPGISAYESIEANHSLALLDESKILQLKGNPLHEDFEEAVRFVTDKHPVFGINVILDGENKIVGSFAGDLFELLYEGAELAKKVYAPPVTEPPDILVSVVHAPLDQNLYQAQKGFENCLLTLKPGGIMILVASCYDGIGPDDYASMLQSSETPEALAEKFEEIKNHYQLGWHKVGSIPTFLKDKELWMVTKLPLEQLHKMFIRGFENLQKAMDEALRVKGKKSRILVVHDSANVCPILQS
ncbi:nickel-dependent lactate racemase [Candidatus Thorarchaeota archaeon]|nr:MAG: nickel-dependent lactate racemase [Candidatus Thorarchaeota archaeon]